MQPKSTGSCSSSYSYKLTDWSSYRYVRGIFSMGIGLIFFLFKWKCRESSDAKGEDSKTFNSLSYLHIECKVVVVAATSKESGRVRTSTSWSILGRYTFWNRHYIAMFLLSPFSGTRDEFYNAACRLDIPDYEFEIIGLPRIQLQAPFFLNELAK